MANPILYGDLNRLPTDTIVAADLLLVGDVSESNLNKATVASVVNAVVQAAATSGTFVANGVTPVVVANANVTANSVVVFTLKTVGGTVGAYPTIATITPTTGFTVVATALDTSTYNYRIL